MRALSAGPGSSTAFDDAKAPRLSDPFSSGANGFDELDDTELAAAIAASLQTDQPQAGGSSSGKGAGRSSAALPQQAGVPATAMSSDFHMEEGDFDASIDSDEDGQSGAGAPAGATEQVQEEDEEDEAEAEAEADKPPTAEELRARRLARFG